MELEGQRTRAGHHHWSDTPTSARAILHHTDQFYVLFCTRLYVCTQFKSRCTLYCTTDKALLVH